MKQLKRYEHGSIMLEVVAVLALMGIMGAMLFRQIYQRNQELHNIQMASEIRTVKEAFSAYIQANRASVLTTCISPSCDEHGCRVEPCGQGVGGNRVFNDYDGVADYLPDGWFSGAGELSDAYTLTIWNYLVDNDSEKRIVYGVVVPTEATLPSTGWNFRRAARVALLIGADGGAYDPTITNGDIAGALGSWQIDASGIIPSKCTQEGASEKPECSLYVATTGIDVFAPEYEAPEGAVGLPKNWDLAIQDLHAYQYFSVGNSADGYCYGIDVDPTNGDRRSYNAGDNMVNPDRVEHTLSSTCKPLFWVGSDNSDDHRSGNVYVQNDLNIGADMSGNGDHALKLTKEGVIRQKNGLTIDADGRIIAHDGITSAVGELPEGEKYMLDPAHISTMGDIRLTSRGGVKLSDILPNYILKRQTQASCTIAASDSSCSIPITQPSCPTGYKKAVAIIPVQFGQEMVKSSTEGAGSVTASATISDHSHSVDGNTTSSTGGVSASAYISGHTHPITHRQLQISIANDHVSGSSNTLSATIGYSSAVNSSETVKVIVQTYCVYNDTGISVSDRYGSADCASAGLTWDTDKSYCKNVYNVNNINTHVPAGEKHAVCKAAGFKWNQCTPSTGCCYSGSVCSCPS